MYHHLLEGELEDKVEEGLQTCRGKKVNVVTNDTCKTENRNDKQSCKGPREEPGETLLLVYLGYMETTTTTTGTQGLAE